MSIKGIKKYINGVSLISGLLMVIFVVFYVSNAMHENNFCIVDSLRLVLQSKCLGKIAILVTLSYLYSTRNDYSEMIILRAQNKRKLWFGQCRQIGMASFMYAVPTVVVALVVGIIKGNGVWINWADAGSYYQKVVLKNQMIEPHITAVTTLIWTMVFTYLLLLVTLVFTAMCYWIFNSYIIALLIVVLVAVNDSYFEFFSIFYNRFTIHPEDWISPGINIVLNIVVLIMIGVVMIGIAAMVANRKEFLGENHISQ